jgi:Peptidase family M23
MSEKIIQQISTKYHEISKNSAKFINSYLTKKRKKQIISWYEKGGKTIIFFSFIGIIVIIIASQFISIKKPTSINQQNTSPTTVSNAIIPLNQAEYAGFSIDLSDSDFQTKVLEHTDSIKKVEVANQSVKMTIASSKIPDNQSPIQTGFNPTAPQILPKIGDNRIYEVKGKKVVLIPQIQDDKTTYTLALVSKSTDGNDTYQTKFNLFGESNKAYGFVDEVSIQNLHKDIITKDTESLDKAISILQNTNSITPKEVFVDTATNDVVKKLIDTKKYTQSSKLKYKVGLLDGYTLTDSPDINQFSVQNDAKSKLEVIKKEGQIPANIKNLKQNAGSPFYRSSSLSTISDGNLIIPIYSNKGDYRTVNLYQNNTQNIIQATYYINLNQGVDTIKTQIIELDTMLATISDNSSKELPKCDTLRGQEMPFGSPLCGKLLEYTKINKQFSPDHKALDIVPNEEYAKLNDTYKKTKKEVFYAPCDGKETVTQDPTTKANIITIKCTNDAFVVQFWHDSESFWNFDGQVKAGDVIGVMGGTGSTDGRHIHYIIEKNGERVDPLELIKS